MDQVIIPCSPDDSYVELGRTRGVTGTAFRKHLLNLGPLIHPKTGETIQLDGAWFDKLKANFDSGVCDIVQVPLADAQNRHTEDPLRNAGEVVDIERVGDKIYSVVDIRDPAVAQGIRDKRLLGASAFLHLDYKDTKTNQNVGPALLHHCITNRPYVTGLEDYEEVVAASADGSGDVVILSAPEPPSAGPAPHDEAPAGPADGEGDHVGLAQEDTVPEMTKDELLAQLREQHGIDVAALEAKASAGPDTSALTAALTEALKAAAPTLSLTSAEGGDGTLELSDVVGAVAELAAQHRVFGDRVVALEREGAETEIDGYIAEGRVLPKQRAAYVTMALTARDQLEVMLPDKPIVALNAQSGTVGRPQGEQRQEMDIDQEILRLTSENAGIFDPKAKRDPRARVMAANRAADAVALTNGHGDSVN
jgi:hypothetical protein